MMPVRLFLFGLFFFFSGITFGQSLKGQIKETNGTEIPFAKVRIKNTSYGTVSNAQGRYVLELKNGTYILQFDASGFETLIDTVVVSETENYHDAILKPIILEVDEVSVTAQSKKSKGKELMKRVIERRPYFYDLVPEYQCDTYCFGSLEKEVKDSIYKDSVIGKEKMNIIEWRAITSYQQANKFKNEFYAFEDFTDVSNQVSVEVTAAFGDNNPSIAAAAGDNFNPYLFVTGLKEAHVNLFENLLELPRISERPLISPLAYNAFVYYSYYLESSFLDSNNSLVYQVRVDPRFDYEALFYGTLYIREQGLELVSYELGVNKAALGYFKDFFLICDYEKIGERLVPHRREFVYDIKEGGKKLNGLIRIIHDDYTFDVDDSKRNFWLETSVYADDAFDKDTAYWNERRPFTLKEMERNFIQEQDSIITYHESDEYKREQDSIRNKFKWFSPLVGYGRSNSFKKQEWYVGGLLQQVIPFGVGGYRHRLPFSYKKEFENGKKFSVDPMIDYGFRNQDVRGTFGGSFTHNPMNFAKIFFEIGDNYDQISGSQNIVGTIAPTNRVRNQKLEVGYRREIMNGLYGQLKMEYSDRQSIENIDFPAWDSIFKGITVIDPPPFDRYKIFMPTLDLEYHFRQKYIIRRGRKIVLGSPYPVVFFMYKRGIPNIFEAQSNFDFMQFRVTDEIKLNTLGEAEWKFELGSFLFKKDLRIIENKFFRPSDQGFFSNPLNTLQLLDTALTTDNTYLQFNAIHHFKGFFLNKIYLINRLKLEETVGGGALFIPDANFAQVEFYAGLERKIVLWGGTFKLGLYAVTADNNFDKANIRLKFGINFYNDFTGKWEY
jgi:Family of unknown function (DUF5686)/CarboxypepD_reg-like domain